MTIEDAGAVFSIRAVNEKDYAHNGIMCPLDWKHYERSVLQA